MQLEVEELEPATLGVAHTLETLKDVCWQILNQAEEIILMTEGLLQFM